MPDPAIIPVGATVDGKSVAMLGRMSNRHGLIAGATGTGKSVTLQALAQGFSALGVPVFTADVKGDLAGLALAGTASPRIDERLKAINAGPFEPMASPVVFWDLLGKKGHPIRTTISEMGPVLLGRLMDLNDVQQGVLEIAFRIADERKMLLLDMKDLRAMLTAMSEHASELLSTHGNISKTTVGALQRKLASLQDAGGEKFFGEPALDVREFIAQDNRGRGIISVLDATGVLSDTRLYSTFLLWMLSELFEKLDEVGDRDLPRLVFFFDEAHLLFNDAPKSLVDRIEQVVRLIRSKGVGVYFVTQSPLDVPDTVLGQLGHRVQHALRAFTPRDQAAVRTAAQTFRANPGLDTATVITELAVGEALVSVLDDQGRPTPVERVLCRPPMSRLGPITDEERTKIVENSRVFGKYEDAVDRESAFEILKARGGAFLEAAPSEAVPPPVSGAPAPASEPAAPAGPGMMEKLGGVLTGLFGGGGGRRQSVGEVMVKSVTRSIGSRMGTEIARGVLGSIFGGGRR